LAVSQVEFGLPSLHPNQSSAGFIVATFGFEFSMRYISSASAIGSGRAVGPEESDVVVVRLISFAVAWPFAACATHNVRAQRGTDRSANAARSRRQGWRIGTFFTAVHESDVAQSRHASGHVMSAISEDVTPTSALFIFERIGLLRSTFMQPIKAGDIVFSCTDLGRVIFRLNPNLMS
jgi:hypothetical protein